MKQLFIVAGFSTLVLTAGTPSTSFAEVQECHLSITREFIPDFRSGRNAIFERPNGKCTLLGGHNGDITASCQEFARQKAFTCFQVTKYFETDPLLGQHVDENLCYACL